jgi:tRNA pseudouridine55 synthase
MGGFLFIDKAKGDTSFKCVAVLRKLMNVRRIGFAGTLDPLASGLMLLAIGEATKLLHYLEKMDKIYDVDITLGAESDTYDAEGKIIPFENAREPAREEIEKMISEHFTGLVLQVPPSYSAIKINGKPAYQMARANKEVKMVARTVNFYWIEVLEYEWPQLKIRVNCGSGTYMRSLAFDLGRRLGCGGYVNNLRRLKIADFSVADAVPLARLDSKNVKDHLIVPEKIFKDWTQIFLDDNDYAILSNGGDVSYKESFGGSDMLAIYKGYCVGVLEIFKGRLKFKKKFNPEPSND